MECDTATPPPSFAMLQEPAFSPFNSTSASHGILGNGYNIPTGSCPNTPGARREPGKKLGGRQPPS
jgi:hypothetical protein